MQVNIIPAWTATWTAAEAEAQLKDFHFNGPGWYNDIEGQKTTMLVIPASDDVVYTGSWRDPIDKSPWRQQWTKDQRFRFLVYNENPCHSFNAIANAPTRN